MADRSSPDPASPPEDRTFETFVELLTRLLGEVQGGKVHVALSLDDSSDKTLAEPPGVPSAQVGDFQTNDFQTSHFQAAASPANHSQASNSQTAAFQATDSQASNSQTAAFQATDSQAIDSQAIDRTIPVSAAPAVTSDPLPPGSASPASPPPTSPPPNSPPLNPFPVEPPQVVPSPNPGLTASAAPPAALPYHRPPIVSGGETPGSPGGTGQLTTGQAGRLAPTVAPTAGAGPYAPGSHAPKQQGSPYGSPKPASPAPRSATSHPPLHQALHQWQGSMQHLEAQSYDPDRLLRLLLPAVAETLRYHIHDRRNSLAHLLTAEGELPVEERLYREEEALLEALRPTLHSALGEYFAETLRLLNQALSPDSSGDRSGLNLLGPLGRPPHAASNTDHPFQPHTTLLIHSRSGLLLARATHPEQIPLDSSSLTPILMSLRNSLTSPTRPAGLFQVSTQPPWHLTLLPGDPAALALVSRGAPPPYFNQQMQTTLSHLLNTHMTVMQDFAGDPHTLPTTLGQQLFALVQAQEPVRPQRVRPSWGMLGLGTIAGLVLGGSVAVGLWMRQQQVTADRNAQDQAQLAAVAQIKAQLAEIERLHNAVNDWDGVQLETVMEGGGLTLKGSVGREADRQNITQLFAQIPDIGPINNQIQVKNPDIATQVYFYANATTVTPRDISTKLLGVKQTLDQFPSVQVRILGYADPTEPLELAQERAEAVQNILADQGIDRRRLPIETPSGFPPGITANQDLWLSRTVVFEVLP